MKLFVSSISHRAGAIFVTLALLSGGFYYLNVSEEKDRAACQAEYNMAFAKSLAIRSMVSTDRQNAADAVIFGVGKLIANPPTTPAEQKKAEAEYIRLFSEFDRASKENEATRAANPLPSIPNCK